MCKFQAFNEGLVIEEEMTFSVNPLIQRVLWTSEDIGVIRILWFGTLTCSAALFSAVLGRFEESGLSEVSDREEGLLEGTGESVWCRSKWLDTAEHPHVHRDAHTHREG